MLNTAQVTARDSVAVIGAGGVGLNCIQGAVLAGAGPIIALDLAADRRTRRDGFRCDARDRPGRRGRGARRARADRGARRRLRTRGGRSDRRRWSSVCRLVRRGGTVVIVGMPPSGAMVGIEPAGLAHDGIRILGSKLGSTQPAVDVPRLARLYLEGRLRLDELISSRSPLPAINEALGIRRARRGPARGDHVLMRITRR